MNLKMFSTDAPLGEEKRFSHGDDCLRYGETTPDTRRRLYIKRTSGGWVWHCKNCAGKGGQPYNMRDIKTIIAKGEVLVPSAVIPQVTADNSFRLPVPTKDGLTVEQIKWLRGYGVTDEQIKRFGIFSSEVNKRLILPIYAVDGEVVGYQGRTFSYGPKYITCYKKGPRSKQFWNIKYDDHTLVVVEDIISAIVVGEYVNTVALLGSPKDLPDQLVKDIRGREYKNVFIWFDPDKRATSLNLAIRLTQMGVATTKSVQGINCDPKDADEEDILALLELYTKGTTHV